MAVGFPVKDDYVTGDVLTAANMNDLSGTVNLLDSAQYAAGKNKIINGDFNINQRAFTSTTVNGTYGFDRFQLIAVDGTTTYSAQTFTPGAAPVAGYESTNFARLVSTGQTLTTAQSRILHRIEDVRTFAGQTVTMSFWAKASTGTPNIAFNISQNFGSGGSSSVVVPASKIAITSSWVRYSATFSIPSISGKTIGTSSQVNVNLWTSAGSTLNADTDSLGIQSITVDFWGIQLEAGSSASDFQTATGTIQGELAACQRYYQRLDSSENNFTPFAFGAGTTTTNIRFFANLPVTMRTSGNVTTSAFGTFTTGNGNAVITAVGGGFIRNKNTLLLDLTTNSATVQRSAYSLEANNSAVASIEISSEL